MSRQRSPDAKRVDNLYWSFRKSPNLDICERSWEKFINIKADLIALHRESSRCFRMMCFDCWPIRAFQSGKRQTHRGGNVGPQTREFMCWLLIHSFVQEGGEEMDRWGSEPQRRHRKSMVTRKVEPEGGWSAGHCVVKRNELARSLFEITHKNPKSDICWSWLYLVDETWTSHFKWKRSGMKEQSFPCHEVMLGETSWPGTVFLRRCMRCRTGKQAKRIRLNFVIHSDLFSKKEPPESPRPISVSLLPWDFHRFSRHVQGSHDWTKTTIQTPLFLNKKRETIEAPKPSPPLFSFFCPAVAEVEKVLVKPRYYETCDPPTGSLRMFSVIQSLPLNTPEGKPSQLWMSFMLWSDEAGLSMVSKHSLFTYFLDSEFLCRLNFVNLTIGPMPEKVNINYEKRHLSVLTFLWRVEKWEWTTLNGLWTE
jgi:hypothetical protein